MPPEKFDPGKHLQDFKERLVFLTLGILIGSGLGIAAIDLLANEGQLSAGGEVAATIGFAFTGFTAAVLFMRRWG